MPFIVQGPEEPDRNARAPRRIGLSRFVGDVGKWVHLCERQGTRLVDLIERWVEAAEEGNRQTSRLAEVAERLADSGEAYLGTGEHCDDEPEPEEVAGEQ